MRGRNDDACTDRQLEPLGIESCCKMLWNEIITVQETSFTITMTR